jgi:CRISP-associated protein Cas1
VPTAAILKPETRIRLDRERLEIVGREEGVEGDSLIREIPLRDLDRLILSENVQITSQAMGEVLRREIPVIWLDSGGHVLGNFLPPPPAHGGARILQYSRTLDSGFGLQIAGRLITAKIYNQRRVLQRLLASRRSQNTEQNPLLIPEGNPPMDTTESDFFHSVADTIRWLDALFTSLKNAANYDELRGYEGAATARYFSAWAQFLPEEFPFECRSTRPPRNAVNACISFGSTLLYNEFVAACHARGLDPALGMLHTTEDGRWSLALDLMEPFRPVFVEALALDCFSHQILNQKHFEPNRGGIYLNDEGRRKFLVQYERRMERQFLSESAGHRTTLRQQIDAQATQFKAALEAPDVFDPFLIN